MENALMGVPLVQQEMVPDKASVCNELGVRTCWQHCRAVAVSSAAGVIDKCPNRLCVCTVHTL